MNEPTTLVGKTIRDQRLKLGITQEELAARSGLTKTTIGMYEKGARIPRLDVFNNILTALGVTNDESIKDAGMEDRKEKGRAVVRGKIVEALDKLRDDIDWLTDGNLDDVMGISIHIRISGNSAAEITVERNIEL